MNSLKDVSDIMQRRYADTGAWMTQMELSRTMSAEDCWREVDRRMTKGLGELMMLKLPQKDRRKLKILCESFDVMRKAAKAGAEGNVDEAVKLSAESQTLYLRYVGAVLG